MRPVGLPGHVLHRQLSLLGVIGGEQVSQPIVNPKAERLVFTVPAPPQELSPNRSRNGHWSKKSEAIKNYKLMSMSQCFQAMKCCDWVMPAKVRVSYEWEMGTERKTGAYRPRDDRNAIASLKALDDGIVMAGAVNDDDRKHWQFGGIAFTQGYDMITVTVEAIEA